MLLGKASYDIHVDLDVCDNLLSGLHIEDVIFGCGNRLFYGRLCGSPCANRLEEETKSVTQWG